MSKSQKKGHCMRKVLRIPDLEQSKHAVLNSLPAKASQESYGHAIDELISWYCSEPRLAFNRTVALRYRFFLEQKNLAPSTINVRLAAVRRLAYEAADTGPDGMLACPSQTLSSCAILWTQCCVTFVFPARSVRPSANVPRADT